MSTTKIKNTEEHELKLHSENSLNLLLEIKIDLDKKKIVELNYLGAQEGSQLPCKLGQDQSSQI